MYTRLSRQPILPHTTTRLPPTRPTHTSQSYLQPTPYSNTIKYVVSIFIIYCTYVLYASWTQHTHDLYRNANTNTHELNHQRFIEQQQVQHRADDIATDTAALPTPFNTMTADNIVDADQLILTGKPTSNNELSIQLHEVQQQADEPDNIVVHAAMDQPINNNSNSQEQIGPAAQADSKNHKRSVDITYPYRAGWLKSSRLCSYGGYDQSHSYQLPLIDSIELLVQNGITCFQFDIFAVDDYTTAVQYNEPPQSIIIDNHDTGLVQPRIHNTNANKTLYVGHPDILRSVLGLMDSPTLWTAEQFDQYLSTSSYPGIVCKLTDLLPLLHKYIQIESTIFILYGQLQTLVSHYTTVASLIAQYHKLHVRTLIMVPDILTAQRVKKHSKWLELILPVDENIPIQLQNSLCEYNEQMSMDDRFSILHSYSAVSASTTMIQSCGQSPVNINNNDNISYDIWMTLRLQHAIGVYTYTIDTVELANRYAGLVDGIITNNYLELNYDTTNDNTAK